MNRLFSRRFRNSVVGFYGVLGSLNIAVWVWAFIAFRDNAVLLETAFVAYTLGLRHAIDADHIAAIDNVTRKLIQEGRKPVTVGFFFALGHSTIVLIASLVVYLTAANLQNRFTFFKPIGTILGTSVSAFFLITIALINLFILRSVCRTFQRVRNHGSYIEQESEILLAPGGLMTHILRPLFHSLSRSWHMYPIGFLFGLGFDTATEVAVGIGGRGNQGYSGNFDDGVSRAVHGRNDVSRHHRWSSNGWCLWMGFGKTCPETVLQHHHNLRFSGGSTDSRSHRSIGLTQR